MHTEEYYRDLMNAEIDGVITKEEARILAARLESDPKAREYYEELRRAVQLLDGADEVSPPADLREQIMDAVRGDRAHEAPRAAAVSRGRTWWRSGYVPAFAAGVAAGLLLYAALSWDGTGTIPTERSEGTIGLDGGPRTNDRRTTEFTGTGIEGSVAADVDSAGTTVLLRISSGTETTALFEYGAGVAFEGISSPTGAPFQMEVGDGNVLIVHRGDGEYIVRLRGSGPVDLKIFAGGTVVASIPIDTNG